MKTPAANYHTHTRRCGHASGTDREYVENALRAGFMTLGFSDHSPMIFSADKYPEGYYSGFRIKLEDTDGYFESVLALREEYKDKIKIHVGVEVEYYPSSFSGFLEYIKKYPIDYMILGQHFVWEEEPENSSFTETKDPEKLKRYYDCVLEAASTGQFLYIAHPDLLKYTGNEKAYAELTEDFLGRLEKYDIPLEINRLGMSDHRIYPRKKFWELAAKHGFKAVVGMDAHDPKALLDKRGVNKCVKLAEKYGIELLDELEIKKF